MQRLVKVYDQNLAQLLEGRGYKRIGCGCYVESIRETIWRGLQVSFSSQGRRLSVQPALVVYCPPASELIEHALGSLSSDGLKCKRGYRFLSNLLYIAASGSNKKRDPFSYDIESDDQAQKKSDLIYDDFCAVRERFFEQTTSMSELRDRISKSPFDAGTGAGNCLIALEYLLNRKLPSRDIDAILEKFPSRMTTKVADLVKQLASAKQNE